MSVTPQQEEGTLPDPLVGMTHLGSFPCAVIPPILERPREEVVSKTMCCVWWMDMLTSIYNICKLGFVIKHPVELSDHARWTGSSLRVDLPSEPAMIRSPLTGRVCSRSPSLRRNFAPIVHLKKSLPATPILNWRMPFSFSPRPVPPMKKYASPARDAL